MSTITIPIRNDIYYYSQTQELEGEFYTFTFTYNRRLDSWHLSIGEDQEIIKDIRLVGGIDILKQFHHLDVPPGELRLVDLDGLYRDPNKTTFGDRVVLQYTES